MISVGEIAREWKGVCRLVHLANEAVRSAYECPRSVDALRVWQEGSDTALGIVLRPSGAGPARVQKLDVMQKSKEADELRAG